MSFIVYHKETTRYLCNHPKVKTNLRSFATERAAKAALTREVKNGAVKHEDFGIVASDLFPSVEKTVRKNNLMSGKRFTQGVNTPLACDPSSETYWSM